MIQIEEVGNNKYRRRHGHQEVIYAPNHETAENKIQETS